MADPTLADLLKEKGKEAFFDELVDAAIEEKIPETAWQSGEPLRAVMSIVARVLAAIWSLALPWLRAPFLDLAEGDLLTLIAWSVYGIRRKGAEFGRRSLTVQNRGPGFYTVTPGQIRIKNGVTGKTFTNTTGGTLTAWGGGAYPATSMVFTADEAGSGSDTFSGDIAETPVTAPAGLFVLTNDAAILGSDEETDEALRVRAKLSQAPLSPAGPRAAYEMIALSTLRPDGNPVDVNRVRVIDVGNCTLEVYLAGNSGPTTGYMNTAGTDVWLVYQALLKPVVPTGITCNVYGAVAQSLTITIALTVDSESGLTADEAVTAATNAVNAYLARFPIGGNRKAPAVDAFSPGNLFASEILAKATESHEGIVAAETDLGYDPVILYKAIPDVSLVVTAELVKQ